MEYKKHLKSTFEVLILFEAYLKGLSIELLFQFSGLMLFM